MSPSPKSLLIVCTGNTCRSPMAEALARRRWRDCRVRSAGTNVMSPGDGAAPEAIAAMEKVGLDIKEHRRMPLSDLDLSEFEYVLALSKKVRRILIERYGLPESKVLTMYVDDPFGNDQGQYAKCAHDISKQLGKLAFTRNSK